MEYERQRISTSVDLKPRDKVTADKEMSLTVAKPDNPGRINQLEENITWLRSDSIRGVRLHGHGLT